VGAVPQALKVVLNVSTTPPPDTADEYVIG
jgi:hypothetical protein